MEELIKLHSEVKQYAVYAHYYEDQLFYIGSGIYHRDNISKSRAYDFNFDRRSQNWFNYCKGETEKIEVQILFTTNDRKLAFDKEEELTKTYIEKGYKLANKNFGTHPNAETRNKMSEAQKGENHYNWGKKRTKETRELISLAQKGENHYNWGKRGKGTPFYGKTPINAKKVLVTNNLTSESKVFDSIRRAHEFISQNGFDKAQRTLQNYLNKGSFSFKDYTIELTK